jgi:hypothetical protein
MNIKNGLICVSIVAILSLCTFNNVAAAPVSKLTPDTHSNYAGDMRGGQQTYIVFGDPTTNGITMGVGQHIAILGVLTYGTPPTSSFNSPHGIPDATVNIQTLNSDGQTWTTVATKSTLPAGYSAGTFLVTITPTVAGVYTYRVTYDGNSQYAPTVSNTKTLTVTNVVIS